MTPPPTCPQPNPCPWRPEGCGVCGPDEEARCPDCGLPLMTCEENGKPAWYCFRCQQTVYPIPNTGLVAKVRVEAPQDALRATETSRALTDGLTDSSVAFLRFWRMLAPDLPEPTAEFKFDESRKWQCDFAWIPQKVILEIDGLGHGRRNRYLTDLEKYNELTRQGYRLYRTTPGLMEADPDALVGMLREALSK